VKADEIDPIYFERGYYMVPAGTNPKAYRLLARVMEDTGLAGVATFVMRAKEYIAAIFAENGILRAETLRFANEVRTPASIGLPKPARVSEADIARMERAIEKLTEAAFSEKELVDESAVKLLEIVEKKVKKDEDVVEVPEEAAEERADTIDLMEALERSLTAGKRRTARKATSTRSARSRRKRQAA
jgi:DNA end-binding protein Ku